MGQGVIRTRYIVSRTVESDDSAVTTTVEAPTRDDALMMMQVMRMQDAGLVVSDALSGGGE